METCLHPTLTARGTYFPCGKCPECRRKNQEEFAQRLYLESQVSFSSWFLTLTYSDEEIPRTNGIPCFNREEIDKYIRSLRDDLKHDGIHLRMFFTCENGDVSYRPHYHAILYLDDFLSLQQVYMMCKKHWHNAGWISVSSVGIGCCKYVAKYCLKDIESYNLPRKLDTGDRNPLYAFRTFSRRPGIGCTPKALDYYWNHYKLGDDYLQLGSDFDQHDSLTLIQDYGPRVIPSIPRTVKNWLPPSTQRKLSAVGYSRLATLQDDLQKNFEDPKLNQLIGYELDGKPIVERFYEKDEEIIKKRIKLRKLKKNVL